MDVFISIIDSNCKMAENCRGFNKTKAGWHKASVAFAAPQQVETTHI